MVLWNHSGYMKNIFLCDKADLFVGCLSLFIFSSSLLEVKEMSHSFALEMIRKIRKEDMINRYPNIGNTQLLKCGTNPVDHLPVSFTSFLCHSHLCPNNRDVNAAAGIKNRLVEWWLCCIKSRISKHLNQ